MKVRASCARVFFDWIGFLKTVLMEGFCYDFKKICLLWFEDRVVMFVMFDWPLLAFGLQILTRSLRSLWSRAWCCDAGRLDPCAGRSQALLLGSRRSMVVLEQCVRGYAYPCKSGRCWFDFGCWPSAASHREAAGHHSTKTRAALFFACCPREVDWFEGLYMYQIFFWPWRTGIFPCMAGRCGWRRGTSSNLCQHCGPALLLGFGACRPEVWGASMCRWLMHWTCDWLSESVFLSWETPDLFGSTHVSPCSRMRDVQHRV